MAVEQRRVVRAGRRTGRAPGRATQRSPDRGPRAPTTAGARAGRAAAAAAATSADDQRPAARRRRRAGRTPPTSQTERGPGVGPAEVEQQPHAVQPGQRRRATASDQPARASRRTSSRRDPLGLQHAGPVGRDQPAREAVVERRAARRRARAPAACAGRRRSCPAGSLTRYAAALLQRLDPHVAARGASTRSSRSRTRTPVQVAPALQPSTQAIGRAAVVCGIARRSARRQPYLAVAVHHRRAGTSRWSAAATHAAAAADWLIGTPCGPSPDRTPSTDTRRSHGHGRAGRREHRDAGGGPRRPQQSAPRQHARAAAPWSGRSWRVAVDVGGQSAADDRAASPRCARRSAPMATQARA